MPIVLAAIRFFGLVLCACAMFSLYHGPDAFPMQFAALRDSDLLMNHPLQVFVAGAIVTLGSLLGAGERTA